ncbi:MAG: peptidyl-prolyl cis-trans isomerase, partial [Flavobacteriia bacterium]|nr:peptidyl-prolyl cis-trans isomerase [Flavobacteriia bacterium]
DLASIQKTVTVAEADLKTFYEQNLARLANLEERRASHILINADKTMPATERDKARSKALEILSTLKQSPDKFAELAKKFSQDTGSANKGGDLDFFARGAMVKPFEEAAFALKKGEISEVVESEFGFHIIRVTDIKQPKQKTFEESRASLEVDAKRQLAQRKFAEAAEQFTNLVYEQSDSLKPAAEKLKLE